jgi:hypothetical protein
MRFMPGQPAGGEPRRLLPQSSSPEFGTFEPNDAQPEFSSSMYTEFSPLPLESPTAAGSFSSHPRDPHMMYGRTLSFDDHP